MSWRTSCLIVTCLGHCVMGKLPSLSLARPVLVAAIIPPLLSCHPSPFRQLPRQDQHDLALPSEHLVKAAAARWVDG